MAKAKFAVVRWIPADVVENARELGRDVTPAEAARLLATEEMRILDAMVAAGWQVIEKALVSRVP